VESGLPHLELVEETALVADLSLNECALAFEECLCLVPSVLRSYELCLEASADLDSLSGFEYRVE